MEHIIIPSILIVYYSMTYLRGFPSEIIAIMSLIVDIQTGKDRCVQFCNLRKNNAKKRFLQYIIIKKVHCQSRRQARKSAYESYVDRSV